MVCIVNEKLSFFSSAFMAGCPTKFLIKLMQGGESMPSDSSSQCPTTVVFPGTQECEV